MTNKGQAMLGGAGHSQRPRWVLLVMPAARSWAWGCLETLSWGIFGKACLSRFPIM